MTLSALRTLDCAVFLAQELPEWLRRVPSPDGVSRRFAGSFEDPDWATFMKRHAIGTSNAAVGGGVWVSLMGAPNQYTGMLGGGGSFVVPAQFRARIAVQNLNQIAGMDDGLRLEWAKYLYAIHDAAYAFPCSSLEAKTGGTYMNDEGGIAPVAQESHTVRSQRLEQKDPALFTFDITYEFALHVYDQ